MEKKVTCSICKDKKTSCAKYQTGQTATQMVCLECRATHCIVCHEILSKEEVARLPEFRPSFYFCVDCYAKEYERRERGFISKMQTELKKVKVDFALQTIYQRCAVCKKFNTSRNREGRVVKKNCKECEALRKDKLFLERVAQKNHLF